ncbi:MAG: hypothetical protein LBT37_06315 [Lactobacillaceae bacterium]|jgi:hypothetical protein|nr:hypothetical protein [Lactobacillaceae bacterium]
MPAITINQSYLDRVGRLIGEIYSAQLIQQDVYTSINVSKATWENVKKGFAPETTRNNVLEAAEHFVSGVLNERRKQLG